MIVLCRHCRCLFNFLWLLMFAFFFVFMRERGLLPVNWVLEESKKKHFWPKTHFYSRDFVWEIRVEVRCSLLPLVDRFREHLRDVEKNNTDASKPVARHCILPNQSHHNMITSGLSLNHGNAESRKNLEQKFIFQLGTLSPHGINGRLTFH